MSKIYDVVDIVGESQFTYQLYSNIKPTIEGSTDLDIFVSAASDEELYVSFTIVGVISPPPPNVETNLGWTCLYNITDDLIFNANTFTLFGNNVFGWYLESRISGGGIVGTGGGLGPNEDPNGNYIINKSSISYIVYKDGIRRGTCAIGGDNTPANLGTFTLYNNGSDGSVTNIVLGT